MFRNNLELILGPVCSGKSGELLRRVDRYRIAGYKVLLIKPNIDTRSITVKSRIGTESKCISIEEGKQLNSEILKGIDIVAFDEAQFLLDIYDVTKQLLENKYKVLISALDADFNGLPFGNVPRLINISDSITKLTAICMKCKCEFAIFSQKLRRGGNQIEIGDLELYEPRCFNCFIPGGSDEH